MLEKLGANGLMIVFCVSLTVVTTITLCAVLSGYSGKVQIKMGFLEVIVEKFISQVK
uniref:Uncharacterized protein n=1 Tax=Cyanothece sp. (strain PCC 7425 / ATCC 29141) TaxID=395961 RepID=B8HRT7_CYAP4